MCGAPDSKFSNYSCSITVNLQFIEKSAEFNKMSAALCFSPN